MIWKRFVTIVSLITILFTVNLSSAEGIQQNIGGGNIKLNENVIIEDSYDILSEYTVTLRNLLTFYSPENFTSSPIKSKDYYRSEYGELDDMCYYKFKDGCDLNCSCLSLCYGDENRERYDQIITYISDSGISLEMNEFETFPLEEALNQCDDMFRKLMLENLVLDYALAMPSGYINELTKKMETFYSGAYKLDTFHEFSEDISAWFLTFRQELDGIKTAGDPQISIVITRKGISMLSISNIIDRLENSAQIEEAPSWQDAMDMFTALHGGQIHDAYSETFEIASIRIAYGIESIKLKDSVIKAKVSPCWCVDGYQIMEMVSTTNINTLNTKILQISEVYPIPAKK